MQQGSQNKVNLAFDATTMNCIWEIIIVINLLIKTGIDQSSFKRTVYLKFNSKGISFMSFQSLCNSIIPGDLLMIDLFYSYFKYCEKKEYTKNEILILYGLMKFLIFYFLAQVSRKKNVLLYFFPLFNRCINV